MGPSKKPCTDSGSKPPYLAPTYWQTTGFPESWSTNYLAKIISINNQSNINL